MRTWRFIAWVGIVLILIASPAGAGGLWLYEMGTPDLGTASAGRAAMALDASTAFGNPAGMTKLERSQFLGAFQLILPSIHFNVEAGSTFGRPGETGNAGLPMPSASGFYVHKISPDWRLGVSLLSYFGLGVQYSDQWAGRYYLQASTLLTVALSPSAAYKVNDWLSVGAGPTFVVGKLKQSSAINNVLPPGSPDGRLTLNSWAFGVGGMAGVLLEPRQGTRFGVTYISPVDLTFDDVLSTDGLGPFLRAILQARGLLGSKVDMTYTLPQQVMVSAYQQITEKFALMANFGWQNWQQFGKINVSIESDSPTSLTADAKLKDTWHVAIGAQYRLAPAWLLSLGFAYDSSAVGDADRIPSLPVDRQLRYAIGIQYDWNRDITLGLAYTFVDLGNAPINIRRGPLAGQLTGDYSPNHIQFVATNLSWKF
jgi:long-chain fatty acid transport protein